MTSIAPHVKGSFVNLDHVNLVVRDITVAKRFYSEVVGLVVSEEFDIEEDSLSEGLGVPDARLHVIFWAVPGTDTRIEMVQYARSADSTIQSPNANAPGFGHLALRVDDIWAVHRTLVARGARFLSRPVTVGGGTQFCFFHDPEGNIIELIQPETSAPPA